MHSVASGYVALAFGTLFALASVPMALHFLGQEGDGKKKFALWVLLTQTSGYLQLIDMGMTGSVSRLLIDHKDKRQTGMYGGLIRTGWLVMLVQAAIVLCGGVLLSPWITGLLKIEPALADQFIKLLRWQSALVALSFSTRMFSQLLYAHQRQDLVNYAIGQLAVSFLAMWTGSSCTRSFSACGNGRRRFSAPVPRPLLRCDCVSFLGAANGAPFAGIPFEKSLTSGKICF
jgi:hypothetical protein